MNASLFKETYTKSEKTLYKNDIKSSSSRFLNRKRNKSDEVISEIYNKVNNYNKEKIFVINKRNRLQVFLDNFQKIINIMKFNIYLIKENQIYFTYHYNLKLINRVNNYFEEMKENLKDANIFNSKDLIELIKTFYINELQFFILAHLINEYILSFSNGPIEKEYLYYIGLYTKYISSSAYLKIWEEMLKINNSFKNWYSKNKSFLKNIYINFKKINMRNNSYSNPHSQKIEIFNYNLMIKNIVDTKNEKKEKKDKIFNNINNLSLNIRTNINNESINSIKSNIGKKLNVIIVYKEEDEEDNSSNIKQNENKLDNSNHDIEGLQTDLSL